MFVQCREQELSIICDVPSVALRISLLDIQFFPLSARRKEGIETNWKMSLVVYYCSVNLLLCKAHYISEISTGQDCHRAYEYKAAAKNGVSRIAPPETRRVAHHVSSQQDFRSALQEHPPHSDIG